MARRWPELVIDRFIPPAILATPEPARRARLAVALAWVSTVLFVVATIVQGQVNSSALLGLNIASAVVCAAAPFVMRRIGRPTLICNVVIGVSFIKYVAIVVFLRGAGLNGATVLLAQLPLVATFLMGLRVGLAWAAAAMIANLGVAGLGAAGIVVDHLPAERRLANDHFILAISTVILFAIAWLYERMKDAAQRHIYELEAARQTAELERVQAVSRSQLAEAQRLASLGRIASATAHEINSPLSTVIANLQLAAETATPRVAESIEAALAAARRISTIVADMNQHARPRVESGTISVRDAVVAATKLAQPHIHARAHVTHSVPGDLPRVVADNGLTDILVNLLVNAAEMLPEGQASSHAIAIGARAVERSVVIEVTQTDSPTAQLGLAMCHSIVDKLGGTLVIDAHVARLTLVAAKPVTTTPAVASPRLAILIVDDDESILGTLERVLSNHAITVANGGRDALGLCAAVEFDLVISDLMMPQLTGMDLYAQLVASDASYADRFVFMTGGTFTERAEEFRTTVTSPFIEKPFNLGELRQVIARFGPRAAATAA